MQLYSFTPEGNTAALSVTSTSTVTPIKLLPENQANPQQVLCYNAGPNDCFLAWGPPTVVAAIPVAGTPANGLPIPAGAIVVITTVPGFWYAAVTAAGNTATLYLTPGEGT